MSSTQGTCPQCGAGLTYRAGEWSCTACDWFALGEPGTPPAAQPQITASEDTNYSPPAPAAGKPLGQPVDTSHARLTVEKHFFLVLLTGWAIGVLIYGLLQLAAAQLREPSTIHLTFAIMCGLGLGAMFALVLYIDWNLPKQGCTILLLAGLGFGAYNLYLEWSSTEPSLRTITIISLAFIPWVVVMLLRDMRKYMC